MRLIKTVTSITFITVMALVYVHQQVELVKVSYAIDCNEKRLKDMLDRKDGLGYNIDNLLAPSRMEKVLLSRNIEVSFPKRANVVMAALKPRAANEERIRAFGVEKRINLSGLFDFLSQSKEVQAKER